jgi:protein tyrosine phosphatase (PTP) superfamily phosphohydrolase (DUF442 family)
MKLVPRVPQILSNWYRDAADAINRKVERDGVTIYTAPTISNPPTQGEVQAIADALEAMGSRLK